MQNSPIQCHRPLTAYSMVPVKGRRSELFIDPQVWVTMALFLFLFIFAVIVCTMVGQDIDIRRVSWQHSGAH